MRIVMAAAAALLLAGPAPADEIADFYRGKQMQMVVQDAAGSSYDGYGRLLARHMPKYLPGNPTIVTVNMPGGGGIRAANYMASVAPKDGTVLGTVSQGLPIDQALGKTEQLKADLRSFGWVGNMSNSNQILVTWHTSQTRTLDDARRRETPVGATGPGGQSYQLPIMYNNTIGTRFKIVSGYTSPQIQLAMERGEVDGRGSNSIAGFNATNPHYLRDKLIHVILQVGLQKEPDLPHVPLLREVATDATRDVIELVSKGVAVGRPFATTPGVPPERLQALRRAFDATMKDAEFQAEAARQGLEIRPMSGEVLGQLVADITGISPALRDKAAAAFDPNTGRAAP